MPDFDYEALSLDAGQSRLTYGVAKPLRMLRK